MHDKKATRKGTKPLLITGDTPGANLAKSRTFSSRTIAAGVNNTAATNEIIAMDRPFEETNHIPSRLEGYVV